MHEITSDEDVIMEESADMKTNPSLVEIAPRSDGSVKNWSGNRQQAGIPLQHEQSERNNNDHQSFKQDECLKENAALREELSRLIQMSEEQQLYVNALQGSNDQKDSKVQELEKYRIQLETNLSEQRNAIFLKNAELQKCKDDLFRLQPMVQPTDSELCDEFDGLCNRIVDWVDTELVAFDNGPHGSGYPLAARGDPDIKALLENKNDLAEHILASTIHRFIQSGLFRSEVVLFGLSPKEAAFLQETEHHMAKLQPQRGR